MVIIANLAVCSSSKFMGDILSSFDQDYALVSIDAMLPNPGLMHLILLLSKLYEWSDISHYTDLSFVYINSVPNLPVLKEWFSPLASLSNALLEFVDVVKPITEVVQEQLLLWRE